MRLATRAERRKDRSASGEEQRDQMERLHELAVLSLFLHSAGTPEEMLSLFLERSPRVTGAVVTYPLLLDRRREVLSAQQLATIDDPGLEQASVAANENLADLEYPLPLRSWRRSVMEGGEVVLSDDLRDVLGDVLGKQGSDQVRKALEITRVAVVPLVMEGEAFGLCVFMFSGREPDVEVLELAAGHCTLALKGLMVGEETTRFGGIDPVTWAHSRGHFLEALETEVTRARRYGRGLSIVFCDIDDFGEFNADYGHTMGDRVLRAVAMTLASSVAPPEMVARYGGDEFALLLPEAHRALAVEMTQRIIQKLDELNIFDSETGATTGIPVSVAIVSYPEDGSSRDELLAAAEVAIEQSKEERRKIKHPPKPLTPVQQLRMAGRRHSAA
ncbi:MAG TPA: sensor domain-containing diguanylate cyclase [Dehalococcoidia bacterium]|nr:sensor domain-containing diguanylate cyclase [Dehalococcoidia bacterium]